MIQYPYTNCDPYAILFASRKKQERGQQVSSYTDKDAADRLLLHKLRPPICHVLQPYVQSAIQRLDYEGSFIYDEIIDEESFQAYLRELMDQIMRDGALGEQPAALYRHASESPCHAGAVKDLLAVMLLEEIIECRRRRRSSGSQEDVTNCSKLQD